MSGEQDRSMVGWTVPLKDHIDALAAKDAQHVESLETRVAVLRAEIDAMRDARDLQAIEYERRLRDLNHEAMRIANIQSESVTAEKFDDYRRTQETALKLAFDRSDARLASLENWRARATGIGVVLVLFSGAVGAAVMRALAG